MKHLFVHLHNHTEYSLLDGAQRIPLMVSRAREMGMPALAISDHGAMHGAVEFYYECREKGIKPILGMEAYVAPRGRATRSGRMEENAYHLLLLAKDNQGYQNLCKLATIASLEGYYYKPRIDHNDIAIHSRGLIATTTCLGSEVCQYLLSGDYEKARATVGFYVDVFGPENYFVELQNHGLPEQERVMEGLLQLAKEFSLKVIATNDAHYLNKEDARAHDVLLCIQTNSRVSDKDRLRFETEEFYLKSPEEMASLFSDFPEALGNTLHIADMCEVELEHHRAELPDPEVPPGWEPHAWLKKLCEDALLRLYPSGREEARERLEYELRVIEQTGFSKYFLVIHEIAKFARERGIYFGVRGSAGGALVSYCLGITEVDPLRYGLTFERFLNPERVQMPDIDMDFEDERRDEVLEYVRERFGEEHVAQICSFGTLGAKQALRDAGRALGMAPAEVDRICKMVPNHVHSHLEAALEEALDLQKIYEEDPEVRKLIDTAIRIEGIARHVTVHAAGVVISKEPLWERVPLMRGTEGQILTQYAMEDLERLGLLKMDFLGLSYLTVLSRAVRNIRERGKGEVDLRKIPLDDRKTFEMLGRGETVGVFQLESEGMRRYIMQLKPESVEELAAMVALHRPGPMEHIGEYIEGKHGRRKPSYLDPRMEPILRETYGVIVYQDQVLQLVRALAGFTLGEADILRKAMGKKQRHLMEAQEKEFIRRAVENGMTEENARKVFDLLEPFAGYAFNKAHAVCYAMIAYQTAYLKAHYPVEYMSALLGAYRHREDKIIGFIEECRRMGISVLPPDINRSDVDFTIEQSGDGQDKIRFGLGAIKGLGEAAVEAILGARGDVPFADLWDFVVRCAGSTALNRSVFEALVKSGAMDSLEPNRNRLLQGVDRLLSWAQRAAKERDQGQQGLFGEGQGVPALPEAPLPARRDLLKMEKEVLGLYLSDHPLRGYEKLIEENATHSAGAVNEVPDDTEVTLAGIVVAKREVRTKSQGQLMALVTIEDFTGQAVITVFPALYGEIRGWLGKDRLIVVSGSVRHRERPDGGGKLVEVIAKTLSPLSGSEERGSKGQSANGVGTLRMQIVSATPEELKRARSLLEENPGPFSVVLEVCEMSEERTGELRCRGEYVLPYKVSDGEWLRTLRQTFTKGFVRVDRNSGVR
jgi:DNA polymerase-3 subunit alpha